jgi:dTMP kinase
MREHFIALEGINCVGKTTQLSLLETHYKNQGHEVLTVREPGGSEIGEHIRKLLREGHKTEKEPLHVYTQTALFLAARTQLAHTKVIPALEAGQVVLTDRWTASTLAYQGFTIPGGPPITDILHLTDILLTDLRPTVTIILDLPVEEAFKRTGPEQDRWEREGVAFQNTLAMAYRTIAQQLPHHPRVDATGTKEEVHRRVLQAIEHGARIPNAKPEPDEEYSPIPDKLRSW